MLALAEHQGLHLGLWARQTAALERASPASTAAAAAARDAAAKRLDDIPEAPSWVRMLPRTPELDDIRCEAGSPGCRACWLGAGGPAALSCRREASIMRMRCRCAAGGCTGTRRMR